MSTVRGCCWLLFLTLGFTSFGCKEVAKLVATQVAPAAADYEGDEAAIVGTWKCSWSGSYSSGEEYVEYEENNKSNGIGEIVFNGNQDGKRGTWNTVYSTEYKFRDGKFCYRYLDFNMSPLDEAARSTGRLEMNTREQICDKYTFDRRWNEKRSSKDKLTFHGDTGDTVCTRTY